MRRNWLAMVAVALVAAAGGLATGRALAEDDPMAGGAAPPSEPCIDGNALVKALTANKWTTKATGMMSSEGAVSFRLGAGKTLLVEDYDSKGDLGAFSGLGVYKWGADGKTVSVTWFDTMSPKPTTFTGPVSDTGFELSGEMETPEGPTTGVIKLVKKDAGFEFTMTAGGQLMMTDVYTPAK